MVMNDNLQAPAEANADAQEEELQDEGMTFWEHLEELRSRLIKIVVATLAAVTVVSAVGAAFFGLWAALAVATAAGLGQVLGKLSMDAVVQREIGEEMRSSTFAVSETLHQLSWVLGGLLGLGMSIVADGRIALAFVAAALAVSLGLLLSRQAGRQRGVHRPRHPGTIKDAHPEMRP